MTLTSRTLSACRRLGWLADVVERWIPGANVRRDLLGFADIFAVAPDYGTWSGRSAVVLIQCTSSANLSARVKKILSIPAAVVALQAGCVIEAWGWRKYGRLWDARRVAVGLEGGEAVSRELPTWLDELRVRKEMKGARLFQ